jgi:hypothetical protein
MSATPVVTSPSEHQLRTGFVGEVESALSTEILNLSIAEHEAQVEPDGMLGDDRRETVSSV